MTGEPVVLLHGAFAGAVSWYAQTPALVEAGFRVHAPERRGHAHTRDVPGPLSYQVMADDTVGYLDTVLGGQAARLVGWSDGAVVALLVALDRPELVERLVLVGQYYNSAGRVPGSPVVELLKSPDSLGFLRELYDGMSPDGPEHFPVVWQKTIDMIEREPEIDLARLSAVTAPTLVLQGDRDEVTLAHSAEVAATLPNGRLAVLPGSHGLPIELPDVVNPLLVHFLRGGVPEPMGF